MVFFICDNCGETLKKNKVDTHIYKCGSHTVSCIDCNKHFDRKSYNDHKTCLQEDEKYGGANYQKKESEPKGKKKQDEWIQRVHEAAKNAKVSPAIKNYLDAILNYDNIPRKKAKFINFVKNSIRNIRPQALDELWSLFESANKNATNNTEQGSNESSKRPLEENEDSGDTKKAKTEELDEKSEDVVQNEESKTVNEEANDEENHDDTEENVNENNGVVKMKKPKLVALAHTVLKENGLKMKRKAFEKAMLSKYHEKEDEHKIEKFRIKIFEKLAKKTKSFTLTDKYVELVSSDTH
ncbi:cell growth-regulating nucleolar protein-like protein [Leptotrombidium deliense]|uniref:Cell growth-regulating nucleolar protein-like protein n=1 Tax=Leptotrombidium deliense TaxID=299467 RepID=A0A443SC20_9ACAR|nr:cell growth-regulating nucleolar protein-like protein [Leptotrombidium deliense]